MRTRAVAAAAAIALIGGAVVVLFLFRLWRSCDGEDTSADCPRLPRTPP